MASDYLEDKINDHILGKTSFTMPQAFIALCTSSVSDAHTGATLPEVSNANNYARVTTTNTDWGASSGGTSTNAAALTFNQASGTWGTASYFAIIDSATHGAGNVLASGTIGTPKLIQANDTPSFAIGELSVVTT